MHAQVILSPGDRELDVPHLVRIEGFTEEDYLRLAPEHRIAEYAEGAIILHSPAGDPHQDLVAFLITLLRLYVRRRDLGEVRSGPYSMRLRPGLVREPDVFFIARERRHLVYPKYLEGPADFAIEVVSEGSRRLDLVTKRGEYERHGVREYWAADLEESRLVVHRLRGGGYEASEHRAGRVACEAVPGLWVEAGWLFERPLPSELSCFERIAGYPQPGQ